MACLAKPAACSGCSLETKGEGFAPAEGPEAAPLLFVGEALGKVEALTGRPFLGDAGGMLTRLFNLLGWQRDWVRIHNTISCRPPNDWLDERAPWYYSAINHCKYLDATLAEPHKVIVTLGATALKRVMGLIGHKKIAVKDWHGTLNVLPSGQIVVPTFHPSFLQRGAHNLIGTVLWDLQQAEAALTAGKPPDPAQIICDPPIEWFRAWVDQVVAARLQDPEAYPISSDVETPDKAGGKDEGEMTADDRSFQILRQNVSCHPDEGITVPQVGPYIDELQRLYASPGPIWEWNREYDFQRQVGARQLREEDSVRVVDLMWLWHFIQSDLPRGLGFVAPFYSGYGPWKHASTTDPVRYAAIDALQTHRIGFGLMGDLHRLGMYDVAMRHTHVLHTTVLRPAQLLGVKIDRSRLMIFKESLITKARHAIDEIQDVVPQDLQPLTPKAGLTKKPLATILHAKASAFTRAGKPRAGKPVAEIKQELYARAELVEKLLLKEVLVCRSCAAVGVQRRHRCKPEALAQVAARTTVDRGALPQIELDVATVTRWFWKEPFNPDSPKQVLEYILWKKHQPGKHKKTKLDTTDRETLERLERQTKDGFYRSLLDYRAVNKVKGTYVEGTERRLDEHDRLHPQPTFKPSTMRLCVAAGTPIEVLRDVARYPLGIPIEDVREGMWAYTFDQDLRLRLRQVVSTAQTGIKTVVRVHWESGWGAHRRRGYVDLTAEHEVRCIDGTYKAAGHLQEGDRVLALARGITNWGYARLWATGHAEIPREHRFVVGELWGYPLPIHVHHRNENKLDNRPDNLQGFRTAGEHQRVVHQKRWSPERRARQALVGQRTLQEYADKFHKTGKAHPGWLGLTRAWMLQVLQDNGGHPTVFRDVYGIDYSTATKYLKRHKINWKAIQRELGGREYNHRILGVEQLPGKVSVYDLEIERTHNFIAGELCVHNSYVNPNITNVVADKGGKAGLAAGFRQCVVAGTERPVWLTQEDCVRWVNKWGVHLPDDKLFECKLLEVDFSAIEAVLTGYFAGDPEYMHLAKLGVHAGLASHVMGRPYDPTWSDARLAAYFGEIKEKHKEVYDPAKRFVHGRNYGLTRHGMMRQFPQFFPTETVAKRYEVVFAKMAPKIPAWQKTTQLLAARQKYLGGDSHPFKYKHWFWSVYTNRRLNTTQYLKILAKCRQDNTEAPVFEMNGQYFRMAEGEDSKRSLAFFPQSTASGVLKEALLRLLADPSHPSYIGDAYFGRTPFRAPIHDSGLFEIPLVLWDRIVPIITKEFQRPVPELSLDPTWGLGDHLSIGVAAKAGMDWSDMEDLKVEGFEGDASLAEPMEDEDNDDFLDLARHVS